MTPSPRLIWLLIALALSGCESMSESQCKVADWGRVGFADAANGVAENRLADYTKDCGKIGIVPNALAYRQGWDAGIVRFCTAANGWREGTQGHLEKEAVCRGQAGYERFAHYLQVGSLVHRTTEHLQSNYRELRRLQSLLENSSKDDEKTQLRLELQLVDREQLRLRSLLNRQLMLAP
jgi:hypothetical protein